jgi:endo-1,4-beta-xylanase
MDIDGATDAEQLQGYQRIFPVFWEHPAVRGVTLWGFRPGLWRNEQRAYLVRPDGSERAALAWLRNYVREHAKAQ